MNLNEISNPIKENLKEFDGYFKSILKTNVSLLNVILSYMNKRKGKQIRPVLVFLSAKLIKDVNQRSMVGAALVELLHNATLIHDDVVDDASERRGIASINAEWNNKIAVLVGDFLLSMGLITASENNEFGFLNSTANAVKRMSKGELLSIDKTQKIDNDEDTYFSIISDKTASLLSTCCEIGAMSACDNKEKQKKLSQYGEYLGIAFQIRDDIFDYKSRSSLIGKPVGNDLKEKKITLPLIHAFTKMDKSEVKSITKKIKSGKLSKSEINDIIKIAEENGGIEYSEQKANEYVNKAIDCLADFEDNDAKKSLTNLAKFVISRES